MFISMKIYLYLSIVLFGFDGSYGSEDQWLGRVSLYDEKEENPIDRQNMLTQKGQQNRDDIIRPCSVFNTNCIRKYLAHKSGCSLVHGPAPDPYLIKEILRNMAHLNVSAVLNDVELRGLNSGKIKEFYVNSRTDTLVLEVEFPSLVLYSTNTIVRFHRKGKEAITTPPDYIVNEFKQLSLTWTIRNSDHKMNPKRGHVFAYANNSTELIIGPRLRISEVIPTNTTWRQVLPISVIESMAKEGSTYLNAFIQNIICDFENLHKQSKSL